MFHMNMTAANEIKKKTFSYFSAHEAIMLQPGSIFSPS